jgi:lipopolysaccharide export system permease protein
LRGKPAGHDRRIDVKTLHAYLLRQVIATLVMTVIVCTLVLLLGSVLRELLPLLVSNQASFGMFAEAVGLLIPFVGAFALPIGMLTATLLVFGRFSADQELTAARASGVSLISLILPVLILSLLLSGLSAAVNLEFAPRCRVAYNRLRFNLRATLLSSVRLPEGQPIDNFRGYIVYVGRNRNQNLQDVRLFQFARDGTNLEMTVHAPRGKIEVDNANQRLVLHLYDATIVYVASSVAGVSGEATFELDLGAAEKSSDKAGISDMTFSELKRELRYWENRQFPLPPKLAPEALRGAKRELEKQRDEMLEPIRVQLHRQAAFSLACFSFTLIGIPLGIRVQRRETNIGVAVALGLVAVYYALIIVASSQSSHAELVPHLWMWTPNFLFQAVGMVLLWRANRGI